MQKGYIDVLAALLVGIVILNMVVLLKTVGSVAEERQRIITGKVIGTVGLTVVARPTVTLLSPSDNATVNRSDIPLVYNVTSDLSTIASCSLYINNAQRKEVLNVTETLPQHFAVTSLTNGSYTWQVNCTDATANQFKGASGVRTFTVALNANDVDGDGIIDTSDSFVGTNASIETSTLRNPVVYVNNSGNLFRALTGTQTINITGNSTEVCSFSMDFDTTTLNLTQLIFEKQGVNDTKGAFTVQNLLLPSNVTKTCYLDKINTALSNVCTKDTATANASTLSSACTDTNELILPCDGTTTGTYNCTDADTRKKVSGLLHSAAIQTDASSTATAAAGNGSLIRTTRFRPKKAQPQQPQQPIAEKPSPLGKIPKGMLPITPPNPSEPKKTIRFEVNARIIPPYAVIHAGDDLTIETLLKNTYSVEQIRIKLYYAVFDQDMNVIADRYDHRDVDTEMTFDTQLLLPETLKEGQYIVYVRGTSGGETEEDFVAFTLAPKPQNIFGAADMTTLLSLVLFALFLILLILLCTYGKRGPVTEMDLLKHNLIKSIRTIDHGESDT